MLLDKAYLVQGGGAPPKAKTAARKRARGERPSEDLERQRSAEPPTVPAKQARLHPNNYFWIMIN